MASDKKVKAIFIDVDGTLTDGKIYYSESGDELKAFDVKDGLILSALSENNYLIVVTTGRQSSIVEKRMHELGIHEVYQGIKDKVTFIESYIKDKGLQFGDIFYIGDDLNDIPVMKRAGVCGCPSDACEEVIRTAHYISEKNGGAGAVRDILETYLKESHKWEEVVGKYIKN